MFLSLDVMELGRLTGNDGALFRRSQNNSSGRVGKILPGAAWVCTTLPDPDVQAGHLPEQQKLITRFFCNHLLCKVILKWVQDSHLGQATDDR